MSLDAVTGFAVKLLGSLPSISGRRSPGPRENAAQERHAKALLHPQGYNVPELTEDRVRVVVFRDDKGVKTPVFDSQVHCEQQPDEGEKEPLMTKSWGDNMIRHGDRCSQLTESTVSEGWRGRRAKLNKKPSSDCELLGEMMFGSMPIKVAGNAVKVHYIRSTDQLMLTKVFSLKRRIQTQCSLNTEVYLDSCPLSTQGEDGEEGAWLRKNHSFVYSVTRPSDQPPANKRSNSLMMPNSSSSRSLHSLPPHFSPSSSPHSPPSPHTLSISSSYTRRKNRARATSLEVGSELYRKVLKPLDKPSRKGCKYAIGVIVCLSEMRHHDIRHFKEFIFSHFTLIDAHLERLKEGVEEALLTRAEPHRQNVIIRAAQAYQSFLADLLSLYKARRIHSPVWLGLVSQQSRRREICLQFTEELGSIVAEIDTKDTKYFFSTLLTAVLSHHLAWVYTVSRTNDNRHSRNTKSLAVLAESHPYNPLWAQLGDMFGAVTQPLKVTRTIITGQSYTLVCRILYLLTYFIRCSEIQPGVVDTAESHDRTSDIHHHISDPLLPPPPPRPPLSSTATVTLEDSGDCVFESRASSAVTMCPSPHTPAPPHGKETPLIRTHPFSFRSPVPSTPEPRLHCGSSQEFQHSASGSVDDHHSSTCRSSSSTEAASLLGSRTPRLRAPTDSLDSNLSQHTTPKNSSRLLSTNGSWYANTTPSDTRQPSSVTVETVSMAMMTPHDDEELRVPDATCGSGAFLLPPERFEISDSHSSTSEMERHLLAADEEIANYDPLGDDVTALPTTSKESKTWHYKKSTEMCASLASLESMGMCQVDTDRVTFDLSRNYASPTNDVSPPSGEEVESPSQIESYDSLSDLAGNSNTFSRNGSSNSIGPAPSGNATQQPSLLPSSLPQHPSQLHRSPTHHICGSIDSGYSNDNSIDISSLTDSAHTGMNDSLFTGPRFSVELSAGKHCNPEHSNILLMKHTEAFPAEARAAFAQRNALKSRITSARHLCIDDESLRNQLEKTAMKRQESDASYVSSTAVRPPTTRRSDTLDSNTTPVRAESVDGGSEEGCDGRGTLTRRRRSGAFSYHGRHSYSSGDYSTIDSREDGITPHDASMDALHPKTLVELRRIAKQRQRQVSGERETVQGEGEAGEEDDVFNFPRMPGGVDVCSNDVDMCYGGVDVCHSGVSPCPPEVRVSCSPSPPPLPSRWIEGDTCSDSELPVVLTGSSDPVDIPSSSSSPSSSPPSHHHPPGSNHLSATHSVNVEESLSPASLGMLKEKRSLLAERLLTTSLRSNAGLPSTPLVDFTELELPSLEEFHLDDHDSDTTGGCSVESTHTQPIHDFGHSLFAGHSSTYLPDFVLHGTSESVHRFQPKLEKHLASTIKHSTVDEPVEHGVAIIADTDTWTCRLMVATKDIQTNDVEMAISPVRLSRYIKLMMASFRGMWEMRMPPDFCLSHLEDRLLELNERGLLLANNLMDHGNDVDISEVLPPTFKGLSIRESDETLLLALAGVHCPDSDLRARLNYTVMRRTLTTRK